MMHNQHSLKLVSSHPRVSMPPATCLRPLGIILLAMMSSQTVLAELTQQQILTTTENVAPTIQEVARELWDLSEVSLRESKSAALLKDILNQHGFTITSEGTAGVPTAFIAEYGRGEPRLGIMLEYDALPDLGNAAVPKKQPREDGVTAGHGCGHNLIGAGALGAALTLKELMQTEDISGTLRVYGGAAEETEGAKVFMARAGLFNDLDAMLHWHPSDVASVANVRMAAAQHLYIEFKGKAAHAGLYPWKGRSALDALEILTHAVNMMREHVEPTARIHYIITEGGTATNVVPEKAALMLTYRDVDRTHVNAGVAWIKDMVKGAALCTQTKGVAIDYFGMYDTLPNTPLAERMQVHYQTAGLPQYTEDEQKFATDLQQAAGLDAVGITGEILPIPQEVTRGGFSDIGDVSYNTPTMGLTVPTLPTGVALHSWPATASHGTGIGYKGAITAAKVLALTGVDVLTDAKFRQQVRSDFDKRTEGITYQSPIPDEIKEPSGLPDEMRQFGSRAQLRQTILNSSGDHGHGHSHDHDH